MTNLASAPVDLVPMSSAVPADRNPAAVFIARLGPGSRRSMMQSLQIVAAILTSNRAGASEIDWSSVRYQHVAAVRAALAVSYAPATVNRCLSAIRGTLKEAWRRGLREIVKSCGTELDHAASFSS